MNLQNWNPPTDRLLDRDIRHHLEIDDVFAEDYRHCAKCNKETNELFDDTGVLLCDACTKEAYRAD